jgi:hypothetical protein
MSVLMSMSILMSVSILMSMSMSIPMSMSICLHCFSLHLRKATVWCDQHSDHHAKYRE